MSGLPYPEDEYMLALARVTYAVSYFEWAVLGDLPHIPEIVTLLPIAKLAGMTTTQIAEELSSKRVKTIVKDERVRAWLDEAATSLRAIAKKRNDVLHARPATIDGRQRLYRWSPKHGLPFAIELSVLDEITFDIYRRLADLNKLRLILNPSSD